MDNSYIDSTDIIYVLIQLVDKVMNVDKVSMNYGLNVPLHNAEIHMIVAIKENEGCHISGLAKQLCITKGAVSQIVSRLCKKGTVTKEQDPLNKSRLILGLTEDGERAYQYHEKYHALYLDPLIELLSTMDEQSKQIIYDFLKKTNHYFKTLKKEITIL